MKLTKLQFIFFLVIILQEFKKNDDTSLLSFSLILFLDTV
jgi:hypothetical protein